MLKTPMATTAMAFALLTAPALAQTARQPPTTTMPRAGKIDVQKLIGHSVTNGQNGSVGEIEDFVVSVDGRIQSVVVGVGGLLGVGERHVALPWEQLTFGRSDDNSVVVRVSATKDQLMSMPSMKRAKNIWIRG